jgi:hypothetical protein
MDSDRIKRKSKRIELSYEVKVRFACQDNYTSIAIKDISGTGLKAVIPLRLVKPGDPLEINMCFKGREIQCKGKVVWSLMLGPALGAMNIFYAGVEFCEMKAEDREFLEKQIEARSQQIEARSQKGHPTIPND